MTLRIVLERPPKGVVFGLQKGRGSAYETVQKQRSEGDDLAFEFTAEPKFVQGPPGQRFVYIDIGTAAGQADSCWSRRLKVPLSGITPEMIDSPAVLEARVPGTGKDGGPSCGSVKLVDGWTVSEKSRGFRHT